MRGRFAPSPTGELHVGSASTALLAFLQVRAAGGTFVLRVEDLDRLRCRPGLADTQMRALRRLGIDWDEGPDVGGDLGPYRQSERAPVYEAALAKLEAAGALYPCYCSRAELERAGEVAGVTGSDPRYPGSCLDLTSAERKAHERAGRRPALRFRARPGLVAFRDAVFGARTQDVAAEVGDFVVLRRDGIVAYQLAVVADDIAMRIDTVLRGADLLTSTPRQLLLYEALRATPPTFAHVPLWLGNDGRKLSKRHGRIGIHSRLAAGEEPTSILTPIARALGLSDRDVSGALELTRGFDLARIAAEPRVWQG